MPLTPKGAFVSIDYDETNLNFSDETGIELASSESVSSISSAEESETIFDGIEHTEETKASQEIWSDTEIWTELQNLPFFDETLELLNNEQIQNILNKPKIHRTALLLSVWLSKNTILKSLISFGADISISDSQGRSLLHLAACIGNLEALQLLAITGLDLNIYDQSQKITPLHCAASKSHFKCLKFLISAGADVNASLSYKSPLHYAVQSSSVECVRLLLENQAIPSTTQVFAETPLHVAAGLGSSEIVKLLLTHGAAVNIQCGDSKLTPLHLAAEDGDAECVRLLLDAGADVGAKNHKRQTPAHIAAFSQCSETLELLLQRGGAYRNLANEVDVDGRTPLHSSIVKISATFECVKILVKHGANVNKPDAFGYTPLHLAALNEFSQCVLFLLTNGGDVNARTKGGVSVLSFITRKTPDVIPKYIAQFDASIKLNDHEIGDVDCEIKLDFRVLVPTMFNKETELLLNFIDVGHRDILKHPLCETFLFLKWRRIRKFFLFSLFYHLLFVVVYTLYAREVYSRDCPYENGLNSTLNNNTTKKEHKCDTGTTVFITSGFLFMLNIMLLTKELFQIAHASMYSFKSYYREWENWLQWLIIISAFCCIKLNPKMDIREEVLPWEHHIAAIGIFFAWLEMMVIVGRFPIFGLYIQMFTTVSVNFVKFMAAYTCLLFAFALSFGVIFANYQSFKELKWSLLKVIIMMSGELEYEDIFFDEEQPITYKYTAQIMFLGFVVLVTIILTNLMVGLAVSDIQGLQQSAGLDRLVRQVELVAHLESMLFSKLLYFLPHKLTQFFHTQSLLLNSQYHWALYIKPNDPREDRVPKELIESIYKLVLNRKEKARAKKYRNSQYRNSSLALSRLNSKNSAVTNKTKTQIDEIYRDFKDFTRTLKHRIDNICTHE